MKHLVVFLAFILGSIPTKSQDYKITFVHYITNHGEVYDPTIHNSYTPINIYHHDQVFVNSKLSMSKIMMIL